ncbi:hypothetical protein D3C76_1280890 [compost metagenome]
MINAAGARHSAHNQMLPSGGDDILENRMIPVCNAFDADRRYGASTEIVTRPFAERPFAVIVIRQNFAFQNDFGMRRHEQIGGIRLYQFQWFAH